jgi:hypothetical protein
MMSSLALLVPVSHSAGASHGALASLAAGALVMASIVMMLVITTGRRS